MLHDSPTSSATTEAQPPASSSASSSPPLQRPSQTPQRLQERGPNDTLVLHSPYGPTRNATYGWGSLFSAPLPAVVPGHHNIHIGISSLNAVPTIGKSDRSMRSLLAQYRKKFTSLEHCYPYHRVGDAAAWQSWADMVRDSNAVKTTATLEASATVPLVNASRFIYTVKANNVLTHTKQLQMHDTEVQDVVQTFFHQRCPLLEPFLGPVLVQLPPSFSFSAANLQRLADLHDHLTKEEREMREVVLPSSSSDEPTSLFRRCRRIRVAVEFRHRSWYRQETFDLLRSFRWALVVAHHHDDATFSNVVDTGAGFLYLRLHGALGKHTGDYGPLAMKLWAEELVSYLYPSGATAAEREAYPREVFVYLNNSDSNVGGTTSSTVDATCLAEHLRHMLQQKESPSAQQPMGSERAATPPSTQQAATRKETANEDVQRPLSLAAVVSAETVGAATASPPDDDDTGDDVVAPSAKRPRTSTSSGASRDDEVVID